MNRIEENLVREYATFLVALGELRIGGRSLRFGELGIAFLILHLQGHQFLLDVATEASHPGLEVPIAGVSTVDLAFDAPPELAAIHVLRKAPNHGIVELRIGEDDAAFACERKLIQGVHRNAFRKPPHGGSIRVHSDGIGPVEHGAFHSLQCPHEATTAFVFQGQLFEPPRLVLHGGGYPYGG